MKRMILALMAFVMTLAVDAVVKPGIEVLRDGGFKELQGKRVGLVTNPSGIDNNLKSTVDILNEAPGVRLVALFGPEHGVRGNAHAGDAVGDEVDPATGVFAEQFGERYVTLFNPSQTDTRRVEAPRAHELTAGADVAGTLALPPETCRVLDFGKRD